MTVPERLRAELAARRAQGVDFGDAWPASVRCAPAGTTGVDRMTWLHAFASTQGAWASAWHRHHAPPAQRAAATLRELSERARPLTRAEAAAVKRGEPVAVRPEAA